MAKIKVACFFWDTVYSPLRGNSIKYEKKSENKDHLPDHRVAVILVIGNE